MESEGKVFQASTDMAVPMAVYTSVMSMLWVFNDKMLFMDSLFMIMLIMGPVVLYLMQRKCRKEAGPECGVAALWRMGVITIFLGTVFTLLLTFCILEYVRPSFFYDQLQFMAQSYEQMPEMKNSEVLTVIQAMIDNDDLPSAWQISLSMFCATNVSGSVMSLFTALVASRK
ncbi:MAG: DUF4199 domain-containing protein [Bacteroidales bacterium]|nr:DUF4199 domain-containing protein [Candidatus Sodaliphilus limicaballi]